MATCCEDCAENGNGIAGPSSLQRKTQGVSCQGLDEPEVKGPDVYRRLGSLALRAGAGQCQRSALRPLKCVRQPAPIAPSLIVQRKGKGAQPASA